MSATPALLTCVAAAAGDPRGAHRAVDHDPGMFLAVLSGRAGPGRRRRSRRCAAASAPSRSAMCTPGSTRISSDPKASVFSSSWSCSEASACPLLAQLIIDSACSRPRADQRVLQIPASAGPAAASQGCVLCHAGVHRHHLRSLCVQTPRRLEAGPVRRMHPGRPDHITARTPDSRRPPACADNMPAPELYTHVTGHSHTT